MPLPLLPEGATLLRIARRVDPQLRRGFLHAVSAVRDATERDAILKALDRSDVDGALVAIPWNTVGAAFMRSEFLPPWRGAFEAAGAEAARRVPPPPPAPPAAPGRPGGGPKPPFRFEVMNPRPMAFLQQHGAELVTEIGASTRQALRDSLVSMARHGWDTRTAATDLMQHIGLTTRLSQAVVNYRAGLEAKGLAPDRIDALVARQAERLLRYRAEMIARTESKFATGNGQRVAWQEAIDRGYVERDVAEIVWQTTETACEICSPMDGQVRTLEQLDNGDLFVGGDGEQYEMPGEPHPQCACSRSLAARGLTRGRLSDVVRERARLQDAG